MNTLALVVLAALTGDLPFEAHGGSSAPVVTDAPHTRVRLVARNGVAFPGQPVEVAIVLESDEGWHTYWKNPGDAGMATSVTWTLPQGWSAGELEWPAPAKFQEGDVATFGYAGSAWLLSTIEPAPIRPGVAAALSAHVEWLECREICLPGAADLTVTLPAKPVGDQAEAFRVARDRIPALAHAWKIRATWTAEKKLSLRVAPMPAGTLLKPDTTFFPDQPGVVEPSAAATLTPGTNGGYLLELTPARMAVGAPSMLEGVLVSGGRAWHVRVPLPPREI